MLKPGMATELERLGFSKVESQTELGTLAAYWE